ncbi:hypothetical protein ABIE41_000423 [Bosea sp. OAE506]|uniref:hypothetical protein n=1 Tax=Bosea sp. OAE506 TaxID=2663870 RepID=UPI0017894C3F
MPLLLESVESRHIALARAKELTKRREELTNEIAEIMEAVAAFDRNYPTGAKQPLLKPGRAKQG